MCRVTKLLVKAGAELEAVMSSIGATPLHLAAEEGCVEAITALVEAGVKPSNSRILR